jgi:hypothetical protein
VHRSPSLTPGRYSPASAHRRCIKAPQSTSARRPGLYHAYLHLLLPSSASLPRQIRTTRSSSPGGPWQPRANIVGGSAVTLEDMSVPRDGRLGKLRAAPEVFGVRTPILRANSQPAWVTHDPVILDESMLTRSAADRRSLEPSPLLRFSAPVLVVRADPLQAGCCRRTRHITRSNSTGTSTLPWLRACRTRCTSRILPA